MTAAAQRKLQKEIENVLKKVDDGITEFDDYWEQATAAGNNGQQKEKLGEELKKSINKLQRLRAQIREWIQQSGVQSQLKDKLDDSRRRIENDMQRFKEFERELKTKAFSTCALARADELELEEAEKMKLQDWLTQTIQTLNDQLDQFEADLELLGQKKSLSNDDKARCSQLKIFQERHRWHVKKLEMLLRGVDNDAIDLSELTVVRDSVDMYVEDHEQPDFYHDEGLYDSFDLAEYEERAAVKPKADAEAHKDAGTPVSSKEEPLRKSKDKEKKRKEDRKDKKKEEKEKKAAGTPQNGSASTKSAKGSSGDIKAAPLIEVPGSKDALREKLDLEEAKVQEDQLLSEAEEFICKICQIHVVGCSPKLTSCSHLFCGDCIAQWFAQHPESQTWAQRAKAAGPERVVPCPVCKQPLNEKRDLYPVCGITSRSENLLLWRMLSSLKIMCANHPKVRPDGKCDWIGEYGSYQKHARNCKNLPLPERGDDRNIVEAQSPQVIHADSESELGDSSSKGQSLRSTPAVTPALVASSPPAAPPAIRNMLPSPTHQPSPAPRSDAPSTPVLPASAPGAGAAGGASPVAAAVGGRAMAGNKSPVAKAFSEPRGAPAVPVESQTGLAAMLGVTSPAGTAPAVAAAEAQATRGAARQEASLKSAATAGASPGAAVAPATPTASLASEVVLVPGNSRASQQGLTQPAAVQSPAMSGLQGATTPAAQPARTPLKESETEFATAQLPKASVTGPSVAATETKVARQTEAAEHKEAPGSFVATATSSFEPTGSNMVAVQVGELIEVLEQHSSGWTYCKNLSLGSSSNAGWVPSWICQDTSAEAEAKPKEVQPKEATRSQEHKAAVAVASATQQVSSGNAGLSGGLASTVGQPAPAPASPANHIKRASAAFTSTSTSQLSLTPADLVEIIERHPSGWTYGRKVGSAPTDTAAPEGWFPDWVVCPQK